MPAHETLEVWRSGGLEPAPCKVSCQLLLHKDSLFWPVFIGHIVSGYFSFQHPVCTEGCCVPGSGPEPHRCYGGSLPPSPESTKTPPCLSRCFGVKIFCRCSTAAIYSPTPPHAIRPGSTAGGRWVWLPAAGLSKPPAPRSSKSSSWRVRAPGSFPSSSSQISFSQKGLHKPRGP